MITLASYDVGGNPTSSKRPTGPADFLRKNPVGRFDEARSKACRRPAWMKFVCRGV